MNRSHSLIAGLSLVFLLMSAAGCKIDDRYNLSNLDTEATIQIPPIPIGNLTPLYLRDFLTLDGEYITTDEHGDYHVSFQTEPFPFYVTVPVVPGEDLSYEFEPVHYEMADLSEMLSAAGQNLVAELPELEIGLSVDSGVPARFYFDAVLETAKGEKALHRYVLDDLPISAGKTDFILNTTGTGDRKDVVYKQIADLDKILSPIPDLLEIKEMEVSATQDQLALMTPGEEYELSGLATVDTPLSFTADSRLDLNLPIEGAEVNLDYVGLKKAVLKMDAVNSIPLAFSAEAHAFDKDGKVIPDISVKTDVPIAAGSTDAPVTTAVTVTLTTGGDLRFSSMILQLSAVSNAQVAGTRLNQRQGLELRNVVLSFPDGVQVTVDLDVL